MKKLLKDLTNVILLIFKSRNLQRSYFVPILYALFSFLFMIIFLFIFKDYIFKIIPNFENKFLNLFIVIIKPFLLILISLLTALTTLYIKFTLNIENFIQDFNINKVDIYNPKTNILLDIIKFVSFQSIILVITILSILLPFLSIFGIILNVILSALAIYEKPFELIGCKSYKQKIKILLKNLQTTIFIGIIFLVSNSTIILGILITPLLIILAIKSLET